MRDPQARIAPTTTPSTRLPFDLHHALSDTCTDLFYARTKAQEAGRLDLAARLLELWREVEKMA